MERFKIVLRFCDINSLPCASAVWINHLHLQTAKYSAILTCVHVKGATSIEKYRKTVIQRLQALEAALCVTPIHFRLARLKTLITSLTLPLKSWLIAETLHGTGRILIVVVVFFWRGGCGWAMFWGHKS